MRVREDYRSLSGVEKSAILLLSLGEDQTAKIFEQLDAGCSHSLEFPDQGIWGAGIGLAKRHVIILLKSGKGGLVIPGDPQRPVGHDAFRVGQVEDHFFNCPFALRVPVHPLIRRQGSQQSDRFNRFLFNGFNGIDPFHQLGIPFEVIGAFVRFRFPKNHIHIF